MEVLDFTDAWKPAYQLTLNFAESGIKKPTAQITVLYTKDCLAGKQVIAVINFPPKKIADFYSECLVPGINKEKNDVVLLHPSMEVKHGSRVG